MGQTANRNWERLAEAIAAVDAAQEPPGRIIAAARRELRDATANEDCWAALRKQQKTLADVVADCLASGLTESVICVLLKSVGARIVQNGPRKMLQILGGSGWYVDTASDSEEDRR